MINWYLRHATQFAVDFNLMPTLIASLELTGMAQTIFLLKIDLVHDTFKRIRQRQANG